ncbi:hypothetical protein HDV64DRAFT_276852 [Trichoderma sp. TUCIM 5745]
MPGQRFTLESIPEEEDDFDFLMTDSVETSCCFGRHATLPPNIAQVTSHPAVLAPQPQYGNPVEDTRLAYPHHYSSLSSKYEYTPSYLQAHSQSPSPDSSTALDDGKPHQTQNLLDFIKERTQTRLDQTETDLSDTIVETNMSGGVIPPESKYSVPPHALPSYDGQVGLHFIAKSLGFSMSSTARDLENFLSRNLVVIACLAFNIVPNPDLIFHDDSDNSHRGLTMDRPGGKQFNKPLLRAIQQQEWTHPHVKEAMVWEEPALEDLGSHQLREMAVQQMRENRPYSLLRHVVRPGDVVL